MWKSSKTLLLIILCCCFLSKLRSQICNLTLSGQVLENSSREPIPFASVFLFETEQGIASDSLGRFFFSTTFQGEIHLSINHISYQTEHLTLQLLKDSNIVVLLKPNSLLLNEAAIIGNGDLDTQKNQSLRRDKITNAPEKALANQLEDLVGVSSIKNGSGIAKPVVHGLYGNRLSILNNGVTQSGQQWGVDHAPEIDPLVANNIRVIQGVGALEYQGNSLGSIILIEPGNINNEQGLQGGIRYFHQTNGRGHGLNLNLSRKTSSFAWRVNGTLNKSGDQKTSDYYLKNTGKQEAHAALQLEKQWNKNWFSSLYLSSFNTEIGVLRGSHIGNLTDLRDALQREVPFYTEDNFSYEYNSPYQKVNHHMAKFNTLWNIKEFQSLSVAFAAQYNLRKEFDVRRGGRSDRPAMSIEQVSTFIEAKYQNQLSQKWQLKSGVQLNRIDNANIPETGILPLIPDYISQELGYFLTFSRVLDKTQIEFGGRADFENRNVAAISNSFPREVLRYNRQFQNFGAMFGIAQHLGEKWVFGLNSGYAVRNPEVNELYSGGLHQGVSGIELGDSLLKSEHSIKSTLSIERKKGKKGSFQALFYHQMIEDFINLNPQNEVQLTIRGAFPVFKYEQTNAQLLGFDLLGEWNFTPNLNLLLKYSFLEGRDLQNDLYLVNMPANNASAQLNFSLGKLQKIDLIQLEAKGKYVFRQSNILASQDFVSPPDAYFILGAGISSDAELKGYPLKLSLRAENILNERFRDYLNRQRYFADGQGFNFIIGIQISI